MNDKIVRAIAILETEKSAFLSKHIDYGGVEEAYDMAIDALKRGFCNGDNITIAAEISIVDANTGYHLTKPSIIFPYEREVDNHSCLDKYEFKFNYFERLRTENK